MPIVAQESDLQKNVRAYLEKALAEPVSITKDGHETVYIISAARFHSLKQAERLAIAAEDLTDIEIELIEASEIPPESRYSLRKSV